MDSRENRLFHGTKTAGDCYGRPLIPLLLAMTAGIATGAFRPDLMISAGVLLVALMPFPVRSLISDRDSACTPLILFFLLGYLSVGNILSPPAYHRHILNFTDTGSYLIRGAIAETPEYFPGKGRGRIVLRVLELERDGLVVPVAGKIRVTVRGAKAARYKDGDRFPSVPLFRGDEIAFSGKIRSISNFGNPGAFDYRRYMAFKEIRATSSVREDRITLEKGGQGPGAVARFRRKVVLMIDESRGSDIAKGVLKALVVGERGGIGSDTRRDFNRAGVGHLLAISGLHMGVVAAAAFFLARLLCSRIDFFLWRGWRDKGAALFAVVPVLGYGILSGMSPSTQRAAVMVIVFLGARFLQRETEPVNTLSAAALIILAVSPGSLFSISFQLSFTAVLGIILVMGKVTVRGKGIRGRLLAASARFIIVSLSAIIATTPLSLRYFNQASLVGLFANILLVPLVGSVVVPLGLASTAVCAVSPGLSCLGFSICCALLSFALEVVGFFSGLSFAAVMTVTPSIVELILIYLLLLVIPVFLKNGETFQKYGKTMLCLYLAAWAVDLGYWINRRFLDRELRVTVIDVGQGAASLVEMPGGYCMLIDGGGFYDNAVFDVGRRVVAPFLWAKKIRTVETIVLSHPQSDHVNGLTFIAENFNVKRLWSNGQPSTTKGYAVFREVLEKRGVEVVPFGELIRDRVIQGARVRILYPAPGFLARNGKRRKRPNYNNNSLVVRIDKGENAFLFPGDIMKEGETTMVSTYGPDLHSTVLIAPHHGSKSSSTEAFIKKVRPSVVVIPLGRQNRFGFPAAEVLDRYRDIGSTVFRTDIHGAVAVTTDGSALSVRTHGRY